MGRSCRPIDKWEGAWSPNDFFRPLAGSQFGLKIRWGGGGGRWGVGGGGGRASLDPPLRDNRDLQIRGRKRLRVRGLI